MVTVVIPTLRRPDLVLRAIDSALRQTYACLEVVVVIDGPDEATRAALRAVEDARLRVVAVDESVGGCDARNLGVKHARGEWIAFLDDDDEWLPDKIQKQMALAADAPEPYPVVATKLTAKSPHGDFIWPRRFPGKTEPLCEYLFNRSKFSFGDGLIQTSMLLTRRSLMEVVPFTSGLPKHQDLDWYLRVTEVAGVRFYFVPEPLVNWYVGENRKAVTNRTGWRSSLDWIKGNRKRMTARAYAGFICTTVASEASREGQWRAFPELLREAFRNGKPGYTELSLFMSMWFVRPSFRRRLRAWRHALTVKHAA
jgi:glycosyltransferase involved in cell wall biosynthesis